MVIRFCGLATSLPPFPHGIGGNEDKGDAEQLAHIEGHSLLEGDLFLLEELHEEAEEEDGEDAVAEVEAGADKGGAVLRLCGCTVLAAVGVPMVNPQAEEKDDEVGNGFVELGGMARCELAIDEGFVCVEDEGPGHVGHFADDFRVHQVAQADAATGQRCGNGHVVDDGPHPYPMLAGVEPHADEEADGAAVTGQSFVAREVPALWRVVHGQEHFHESNAAGQVVAWLVEDAVTQACSDEGAEEAVDEEGVKLLFGNLLLTIEALHDEVG